MAKKRAPKKRKKTNPRKSTARKSKASGNKKRAGAKTATGRQNTVKKLVELQQESIKRMASVWANAADRASKGNFSLTQWLTDYSTMWGDLTEDYAKGLKAMFPAKR